MLECVCVSVLDIICVICTNAQITHFNCKDEQFTFARPPFNPYHNYNEMQKHTVNSHLL